MEKHKSFTILLAYDSMDKKRYAPLINVDYGLAAAGEAVIRAMAGDMESVADSSLAAIYHIFSGIIPYGWNGEEINRASEISNLTWCVFASGLRLYCRKNSKSFTFNVFPLLALSQIGTNELEYKLKE